MIKCEYYDYNRRETGFVFWARCITRCITTLLMWMVMIVIIIALLSEIRMNRQLYQHPEDEKKINKNEEIIITIDPGRHPGSMFIYLPFHRVSHKRMTCVY